MKRTAKILQVIPALNQGGVEQGTLETSNYIVNQGWQSIVVSNGGKMVEKLVAEGSTHIKLPLHKRNPLHIFFNTFMLIKIINSEKPDIVHARSRAPAWSAYFACKFTKTPFLTSFHGTHGTQNWFKIFYNRIMLKGIHVIANSNFIKNHIIEIYKEPAERITVVQRGFDQTRFNPKTVNEKEIFQKYDTNKKTPIILMPGRFTRWKGQDTLLKALPLLKTQKYVVLLVGSSNKQSNYTNELKELSENKNIAGRVIFCGTQSELAPYYKAATLTISASAKPEAFGRVAVESQAMSTPIIATAHGGSLETVKDNETGWLIPPSDPKAMALTIDNALKNPKTLASISKNAYNWAHAQFTIDKMCQGEFKIYEDLLK
jgi:glycosyltransferase involved in cell wall biosynthesis